MIRYFPLGAPRQQVWHTALPNLSASDRASVILYYDGGRAPTPAFAESVLRLDAVGRLSRPSLRRLLIDNARKRV
jgi:hypothetical protein